MQLIFHLTDVIVCSFVAFIVYVLIAISVTALVVSMNIFTKVCH